MISKTIDSLYECATCHGADVQVPRFFGLTKSKIPIFIKFPTCKSETIVFFGFLSII